MQRLPLNTSFKHHTIVALVISLWLVVFLVVIAPFDAADLDFNARFVILPIYGVISFVAYMLLIPLQNWVFQYLKKWIIPLELLFIIAFNFVQIVVSFVYYKTDLVNGDYNFQTFGLYVYLPIALIILPIIIFCRWFLNKKTPIKKKNVITLKGDNKLDVLKILPDDLICVSSADNYVEVSYLIRGELHKKLLRNTLKAIQHDLPDLLKVHRSHLINPAHFKAWNDSKSIKLTGMEIPVSKNYKSAIMELI
ncbi:LytTR family DNA-binding domain-containing protein [Winogradskyella flava]|uniref:LytTR family transcriptional regulator n=1 Tax=Winogradskyella flava TaxID=1884876 RepID=A0A842IT82_9FLAO|nr:LytTR family DNA-binding domain-containing protein [Winogradskyella flava]MBC2845985.1 LytTR family transcriptional regulator [Winogradskyella flava]